MCTRWAGRPLGDLGERHPRAPPLACDASARQRPAPGPSAPLRPAGAWPSPAAAVRGRSPTRAASRRASPGRSTTPRAADRRPRLVRTVAEAKTSSTLAYQNSASRRPPRRHIVAGCDAESLGQVARSALLLPLRVDRGGGTPFRVQQRASALQTPAPACGSAHLARAPSLSRSPLANAVEASATRSMIGRGSPMTSGSFNAA